MMDHHQPSIIFMILFLLLFLSSPSYLISLKIDWLPSEYVIPSTNTTTTSWMINQLSTPRLGGPSALFTPILLSNSSSSGSQFISGFYCDYYNTLCFFGIIIFQNNKVNLKDIDIYDIMLVWSANRNYPLQGNSTLKFTPKGDLVLENAEGNLVWSTNTTGKPVLGLKLTESGNLVLFGNDHSVIWQSFDYPTDTLLRGQTLLPGQKLIASLSTDTLNQGLCSINIVNHTLFAYLESNPPQVYFSSTINLKNGTFDWFWNILQQNLSTALAHQFLKLDANCHLNIYEFGQMRPKILIDLLPILDDCDYPMACGRYGICSQPNQCSCPEEMKDGTRILRSLDIRQPNLGCTLLNNISCGDSQYHNLVELENTTYFNFYLNQGHVDLDLKDCKLICLRNCSCKAIVYAYYNGGSNIKSCLLINEVFSLEAIDMTNNLYTNISVFLKVQEFPTKQNQTQDSSPQNGSRSVTTIVASIVGIIIFVSFLIGFYFLMYYRRRMVKSEIDLQLPQLSGLPTRFSYEHLKSITGNFSKKIGEGGFGSVFEGTLSNGIRVAVKCLNGFDQLKKSFFAEVETIGNIHHVNLVKLIGYCVEESYTLLVYEYMSNGSLDKWIFYKHKKDALSWELRKKIIVDIAKGLAYLHEECRQKILHLDIKPQNILLDENFNAKISDFGLAKLVEKDHSQIITTLRGTPGYIAPEWVSLNITDKVDVYSFGVVVMEILCGRPNLDRSQIEDNKHLLGMFRQKGEEGRFQDLINKDDLEMQSNIEEVVEIIKLAAWCLQCDFSRRPSMTSVVKVLECAIEVEKNLDYNFTNPPIEKLATDPNLMLSATTPLLPSILSGPR
ncbi:G-type lectin S-receptor-like serine/threonine-protein kinase SD2-5 [Impatiens glandulifera]|uniref:G-type lectin S-receptor-like serine/threonine-protein kinase SD2-5 n=1 Tax=Impatiens glandulifera TaxID=253017 RepID=UPI001FB15940|nr:G-type lectin S-receptor-like serine/threonine-protein kinase SD2-5 [Impatiens glandulifera]